MVTKAIISDPDDTPVVKKASVEAVFLATCAVVQKNKESSLTNCTGQYGEKPTRFAALPPDEL